MRIPCDCENDTFHLNLILPTGLEAECTECGETRPIGETSQMIDDQT